MNAYLVPADRGFILIDTGTPEQRARLDAGLEDAGCTAGDLRLVVLTHGDYDHAGNGARLRERYGVPLAMHRADWERVEHGDWTRGFKAKPDRFAMPFRLISRFVKPGDFTIFKPDIALEDGQSLAEYGVEAGIIHLPGHTAGSIGVLLRESDLVCGDLMSSMVRPGLHFFIDDMAAARASLAKVQKSGATLIYPGHGKPFALDKILGVRPPR